MIVSNPAKVGQDAGTLVDIARVGVTATADVDTVLAAKPDAVDYTATGDTRPADAIDDVRRCLAAGASVVIAPTVDAT